MADGKIVIDVQVNGQKLNKLSSDLKSLETDAKSSARGLKQAGDNLQNSGDKALKSGQSFKVAGSNIKDSAQSAKTGGERFKDAAEKVKEAGVISKTGGNGFKVSADLAKRAGEVANQSGNGFIKLKDHIASSSQKAKESASDFDKLKASIKNFSVGAVAFKAVSSAMDLVSQSMDKAIDRFDTLQRFPKVMKAFGHSSKDVAASTKLLSEGIEGLPTTLDTVVATTQKLTSMTGNLKQSTKLTIALNNAFLASGASTEEASRGLTQYTQMLSSGKVDLQSWKTLQETMSYALQKTAESFGYAGASAQNDLYKALQDGKITFSDFSKRLIELNKGVNGFAEMAKKNSEGIRTSFTNIVSAIAKGIANVITEFDKLSKAVTGKSIAEHLNSIKDVINNTFNIIINVIRGATPVVKSLVSVLGFLKPVLDPLIAVFTGVVGAVLLFKGAMLGLAIIKGIGSLIGTLIASLTSLASTSLVATGATTGLAGALASLSSGGVFLVIGAIAGLVSWLTQESEASKEAKAKNEEFKRSLDDLHESVNKGNEAYKDRRNEIQATAEDNERLVRKIDELNAVENKTAAQKKELASAAETLNSRIEGLNIQYDKATGTINMTTDAIRKQIEIAKASAEIEAANEKMVENAKKRLEIKDKMSELEKKYQNLIKETDEAEDGIFASSSVRDELKSQAKQKYNEEVKKLQDDIKKTEESDNELTNTIVKNNEAKAKSTEDASGRMIYTMENMNDAQRKAVEMMQQEFANLKGEVQNAFQAIEQQTAISAEQMTANLQKNIEAVDKWAGNLEELARRGLDQGLVEQLRQAGPKAAEQTQALVNASDEQLGALNTKWTEAGDKAKEGFLRGIKATGQELPPEIQNMVTAIGDEFRSALADAGFEVKGREIPQKTAEGIRSGAQDVAQATSEMTEASKQAFNNLPTEAKYSGSQASSGFAQGITEGTPSAQIATNYLKTSSMSVFDSIMGEAQGKGTEVGSGLGTGVSVGIGATQAIVNAQSLTMTLGAIAQMAIMASSGHKSGTGFGTGVSGGIGATQGKVDSSAKGLNEGAKRGTSSMGSDGRSAGNKFGSGLSSGISGQTGAVSGSASNLRNSATNSMQGGYNGAYNAGTSIGEGLGAGISAMAGYVANAAASIASVAVASARSVLRINSPSKVFRDQIGRAIPEGMAAGISKFGYYVNDSMSNLAYKTIDAGRKLSSGLDFNLPKSAEIASGLNATLGGRFGGSSSVSNSNVTNNYTLNANGTANDDFFSPDNMKRLLREMAYYTNLEGGRMA